MFQSLIGIKSDFREPLFRDDLSYITSPFQSLIGIKSDFRKEKYLIAEDIAKVVSVPDRD